MKKKLLLGVASLALVAALSIGGTLAYLTATTDKKVNSFTGSKGITGELTEEDWTFENDTWSDYLPGQSHAKTPIVTIKKGSPEAYVALKVVVKDAEGNVLPYDVYKDIVSIDYSGINNYDEVKVNGDARFFVAKDIVNAKNEDVKAPVLFSKVTINAGLIGSYSVSKAESTITYYVIDENGNKEEVKTEPGQVLVSTSEKTYVAVDSEGKEIGSTLPSFDIEVTGYAVQADETANNHVELLAGLADLTLAK